MRQIERMMIAAIKSNTKLVMNNTEVVPETTYSFGLVKLHGNTVAEFTTGKRFPSEIPHHFDDRMGCYIIPVLGTFAEWATPTTRSRLVALGVDARIVSGMPQINYRYICKDTTSGVTRFILVD